MNGYNDKMSVLVKHILDKVKQIVVDPTRLAVMKEQVNSSAISRSALVLTVHRSLRRVGRTSSLANRINCLNTTGAIC